LGLPSKPIPVDFGKLVLKAIRLEGIYGREMFETWYKMIAMLESGLDVSRIITHQYAADEFQKGFDAMRSGKSGVFKGGEDEFFINAHLPPGRIVVIGAVHISQTENRFICQQRDR
ncbi:MAG: hypothetical protein ACPGRU_04585, partial [Candidatus Puniceispirillaceae bacterium]